MRLNRLGWLAAVALMSNVGAWVTLSGCSGDDNKGDAGDATPDQTADVKSDVVVNDAPNDVSDGGSTDADADGPTVNPFQQFAVDYANALCQRFANCCYGSELDASAPDAAVAYCAQQQLLFAGGIENPIGDLRDTVALNSGHLQFNNTAKASCLAGVSTFSCPLLSGTEYGVNAQNCNAAIQGTIPIGQSGCRRSLECVPGAFCQWPNEFPNGDASAPAADGGENGTCVALSDAGGPCDSTRGNGNEQCMYRGWVGSPALQCDGTTNQCAAKLSNGGSCSQFWECASNTCDFTGTCVQATSSLDIRNQGICTFYFGQDSGLN